MPRSHVCAFCGHEFPHGQGIMYVKTDGTILWYCSSKCKKNSLKLKRDSRKLKWTAYYGKKERGKG
ncbi:50S ribosomal protein L24e [Candidatus Bathyarchaeota archaeon]|nr:MAG: 50S ribosomal protein L24e [Candidatus Hecatellales archaeon]RLI35744.1 MAG: 50S ribosomal protein L24e [Candidatus Bathyarchaeota archaeon]